jgi:hypothetical protein
VLLHCCYDSGGADHVGAHQAGPQRCCRVGHTWSGVVEKAGMGACGMDSRCGAMALRMMLRRMPAASS